METNRYKITKKVFIVGVLALFQCSQISASDAYKSFLNSFCYFLSHGHMRPEQQESDHLTIDVEAPVSQSAPNAPYLGLHYPFRPEDMSSLTLPLPAISPSTSFGGLFDIDYAKESQPLTLSFCPKKDLTSNDVRLACIQNDRKSHIICTACEHNAKPDAFWSSRDLSNNDPNYDPDEIMPTEECFLIYWIRGVQKRELTFVSKIVFANSVNYKEAVDGLDLFLDSFIPYFVRSKDRYDLLSFLKMFHSSVYSAGAKERLISLRLLVLVKFKDKSYVVIDHYDCYGNIQKRVVYE